MKRYSLLACCAITCVAIFACSPGAPPSDAGSEVDAGGSAKDSGAGGTDSNSGGTDSSTSGTDSSTGGTDSSTGGTDSSTGDSDSGHTQTDAGPSGGASTLLVATSFKTQGVDVTTGETSEVHADTLRWTGQGYLYQNFDLSPNGATAVVYQGANPPSAEARLWLYALDGSAEPKVLVTNTSSIAFPSAPCFRGDNKILVVASNAIWSIDPALDAAQAPVKVADITPAEQNGPLYWNRDCSAAVARAFNAGNTNTSAHNVAHLDAATGALTQISEYGAGDVTLAQAANYPGCSGSGCVTAQSGGTIGAMGWLPDGTIYFTSNRDLWRDSGGSFQGAEKVLRYDPQSPQGFDQLAEWTGPRPQGISRDGALYATFANQTVQIFQANGTPVSTSSFSFNAANIAGFMRFAP